MNKEILRFAQDDGPFGCGRQAAMCLSAEKLEYAGMKAVYAVR